MSRWAQTIVFIAAAFVAGVLLGMAVHCPLNTLSDYDAERCRNILSVADELVPIPVDAGVDGGGD